jgi:hypothetical protein
MGQRQHIALDCRTSKVGFAPISNYYYKIKKPYSLFKSRSHHDYLFGCNFGSNFDATVRYLLNRGVANIVYIWVRATFPHFFVFHHSHCFLHNRFG